MSDSSTAIELVIEGAERTVAGFVRGLFIGARATDWPVINAELGVESETLAETLKGWVGLTEPLTHIIVTRAGFELIKTGLADPRCPGLGLRDACEVVGGTFSFTFTVFTDESAAAVRAIFSQLPPGVTLDGYSENEKRRGEDSEGVELYSPVHHYKLSGHGAVRGPFRAVLYVHEQARRIEQVKESVLALQRGARLPIIG